MATTVVNIRLSEYDVYIGRAGHGHDGYFGNPFSGVRDGGRERAVSLYREYFLKRLLSDPEFARRTMELKGKRLGCFCAPKLCHGNVIADYLDIEPGVKPYVDKLLENGFFTFMSCDGGDGHDFKKRIIRIDVLASQEELEFKLSLPQASISREHMCFKRFEELCNFVVQQGWTYCTPKLVWPLVLENTGLVPHPYFELVWN